MRDIKTFCDEELLDQMAEGETAERAFRELYSRHWSTCYLSAYNRLRSRESSEEIVQDFFASLWIKKSQLKLKGSFVTYMHNAVRYNVINQWQKENVRKKHLETVTKVQLYANDTERMINLQDLQRIINSEIHRLPERCRMVYTLSREGYRTNKEIASELGISEKTVENQLTKALKRLKVSLQQFVFSIVFISGYIFF